MKRIEILKEYRKMRFEELYGDGRIGRLSQEGAAELLEVCSRKEKTIKGYRAAWTATFARGLSLIQFAIGPLL